MRFVLVALLVAATAHAQKPPVSGGRIAGEIATGMLAVPVGFAVGYTVGSGFRPHGESNTGVAVGFAGALLAPPVAVHAAAGPTRGSFGATLGGTAIGYAASILAFPAARKIPFEKVKTVTTFAALLLPAVGATIGYNATRR